ncbi:MAG: DUF4124 domain-containing protein [Betaproteobacteria bacterium]
MVLFRALILVAFVTLPAAAGAQVTEIYKCVEPNGRLLYTSDKRETEGRKCELVSREVNVVSTPPAGAKPPAAQPASPANRAAPGSFPRETASQKASARDRQRGILAKELATEQQLLARARQELSAQEAVRTGDERNYAKALERLQPYRDSVETHQKNIEALRRELANLNR